MELYDGLKKDAPIISAEDARRAVSNSFSETKRKTKAAWKKGHIAGIIKGTLLTGLAVTIIGVSANFVIKHNESKAVEEAIASVGDPNTISIVEDSRKSLRTPGTNDVVKYIDINEISVHLAQFVDLEDMTKFHQEVFRTYHTVCQTDRFSDAEVRKTMDLILERVRFLTQKDGVPVIKYGSFSNYVASLGCVNGNEADHEQYREQWEDYHQKQAELDEINDDMNLGGR